MKKFLIAEAEKSRILGMHYKAMGKSLVNEQDLTLDIINSTGINRIGPIGEDDIERTDFAVRFSTTLRPNTTFLYSCISDPTENQKGETYKPQGTIYDNSWNNQNPKDIGLKGDYLGTFKKYCSRAYTWLANYNAKNAPQAQVANPTPEKVTAPNPISEPYKRSDASKSNDEQTKVRVMQKLSDPNFLNPNKEKSELDKDANEVATLIAVAPPSGDEALMLKRRINSLIKVKPEYKSDPYFLSINF